MWLVGLLITLFVTPFLAQTQNYTITELPLQDDCEDANAEKRFDNSSCTLTCNKLSISENPGTYQAHSIKGYCFGSPVLTLGCYCKQYYYKDETTNRCVPSERCPCNATNNEVARYSNECGDRCATYHSGYCSNLLRSRCYCDYIWCRNDKGVCVLK